MFNDLQALYGSTPFSSSAGLNLNTGMGSLQQPNLTSFNPASVDFSTFNPLANSNGWLGQANQFLSNNAPLINLGLSGLTGITSAFNSWNNNKLQSDALNFQKSMYNTNLENQRKTTNMDLSDRQMRRVSANPDAESVDSYMKKWGV